ncbi:RAB6-interacting golgin [Trema orientale]|uniref:RAB6-interacting golgin n=1 Tax=Trema orientale TaxID=63057 RepID=A0A2P5ER92_TREOI|nr:RAB6-interacting golgin [Trema orientale]
MGSNPSPNPSLLPEIGPDGLPREAPVIAYTEKIIEAEQLQLRKYIEENYSKIRDVERELANLTMEMKLTAGPKKAALEHLRKKIEMSTERIRLAKLKEEQAQKAWEDASKAVKDEEQMKQKLCDDLNQLVQESSNVQFSRLEELKRRLEALNPSRASSAYDGVSTGPPQTTVATDASSATNSTEPGGRVSKNIPNEGNGGNVPAVNGLNQQASVEGEGRAKKKSQFQGRGRGLGAVPKGRGSPAPGWTGAGFDVDGRT